MKPREQATIRRGRSLVIHKAGVIRALRTFPQDWRKVCASPEFETCDEFIEALEADQREWFVNGALVTEAEKTAAISEER